MRIPSGKVDQVIYFVAVDSTDLKTRETGLSSFTVYRSRNGGAATVYTTPTVAELSAANMPGVYSLLIDEDTTIGASSDSEEYVVHITQAAMAPVTRSLELYRRDTTSGQTITVANGAADADIERLQGSVIATPTVAGVLEVDVTHWIGTAAATPSVAGVPEVDVTHFNGTAGTFAAGRPEVNTTHAAGTAWNSGAIGATTLAADTLTAAKVAADVGTEIAGAVWNTDATGFQTQGTFGQAIGDPVADTNTIYKAVVTDATGATVGVDVVAVKAETASIQSDTDNIQTRLPAALVSGRIDASVGAVAADAITAAGVAADVGTEIAGAVWNTDATGFQTQGTFGQAIGDPVADTNTIYKAVVTDATGATVGVDVVAVKAETASIQADTNDIQTRLPAALVSGRMDSSVGAMAANVITAAATAADFGTEIAGAVWDEDATGHQTQGTFGQAIGDPVADANTIYKAVVTDATGATVGVDVVAVKAETASIQADTNDIQTRLPAALVSGRIDASVGAMAADTLTASALATSAVDEIVDGVHDEVVEGAVTLRQSIRLANSANAAKLSGMSTTTVSIRDIGDTKDRIVATVDAVGNRTAITRDLT